MHSISVPFHLVLWADGVVPCVERDEGETDWERGLREVMCITQGECKRQYNASGGREVDIPAEWHLRLGLTYCRL